MRQFMRWFLFFVAVINVKSSKVFLSPSLFSLSQLLLSSSSLEFPSIFLSASYWNIANKWDNMKQFTFIEVVGAYFYAHFQWLWLLHAYGLGSHFHCLRARQNRIHENYDNHNHIVPSSVFILRAGFRIWVSGLSFLWPNTIFCSSNINKLR